MDYISKIDLFRCVDCNQIIPWTLYDFAPKYDFNLDKDELKEIAKNDRKEFVEKHKEHQIETLQILKNISDFPYIEPIRIDYLIATNGQEKFLIKRFRDDVNEPMKYDLIDSEIFIKENPEISIQREGIKKEINKEKNDISILDQEIDSFLVSLNQIACTKTDLFQKEDIIKDNDQPLTYWAKLSKELIDILHNACKVIFSSKKKLEFIKQFIKKHNDPNDVLAVRMKKIFWLKSNS